MEQVRLEDLARRQLARADPAGEFAGRGEGDLNGHVVPSGALRRRCSSQHPPRAVPGARDARETLLAWQDSTESSLVGGAA